VHHIKNVVSMQQSLSRGTDIKERCYVNKLVDDAIAIHTESFEKYQINIERQFEAMPELELDKVKTLQILVNLVKNALESIVERNGEEKKITVKTYLSSGFLNIEVIDTGKGILPEDITKVFAYGFTTKKEGHGIGLHSCSLSAQEGGGSLKAYSDGDNKGATFVLCLPAQIYEAKRESEV
jgi:C4-dicarboxylate-specific signal transduction histidine kinase